jgi:hypothetical protein
MPAESLDPKGHIFHRRSSAENEAVACGCWLLRQPVNEMSRDCGNCRASCVSRSPRDRRGLALNRALSAIRFSRWGRLGLECAPQSRTRVGGIGRPLCYSDFGIFRPKAGARSRNHHGRNALIIALQRRTTRFPLPFRPVLPNLAPSLGIGNIFLTFQLVDTMPQFKTP